MRLLIGAFLLAASLASVNTAATACSIDLAPCEESAPRVYLPLVDELGEKIPAFTSELDISSAVHVSVHVNDPSQRVALLNHEDDSADIARDLASESDLTPDLNDALPTSTALADLAIPMRRFLLEDEDLLEVEHTGAVETASATPDDAQALWAQDGYEDR
jgi:hypothetical protein